MTWLLPEISQPEEKSRTEDRDTSDQTHGISRASSSQDQTNSNPHDRSGPGIDIQESHQANSQIPMLPGRSTRDHVDVLPHTSSFTHLRRNAVSEGMPDVDYRAGGLSTREPAHGAEVERHYPAQVSPANSLTSSTEAVLNGGDTDEDGGEKAVHGARLTTARTKGKHRRSDDDVGGSSKRQG